MDRELPLAFLAWDENLELKRLTRRVAERLLHLRAEHLFYAWRLAIWNPMLAATVSRLPGHLVDFGGEQPRKPLGAPLSAWPEPEPLPPHWHGGRVRPEKEPRRPPWSSSRNRPRRTAKPMAKPMVPLDSFER